MPRAARIKSESGIYHVILRGINHQIVFECDNDKDVLLKILLEYRKKCNYKIYAYCLMDNHIHLMIEESKTADIGMIMKKICSKYVMWYNKKYKRTGHLFQDRFKSEPVESDEYLLTVIRYIHQNPLIAKMVNAIDEFKYSSYQEYVNNEVFIDKNFILGLFDTNISKSVKEFIEYNNKTNDDLCLEYNRNKRIPDVEAIVFIKKICGIKAPKDLQNISKEERDIFLKKLRKRSLSIKQLERLTGISRGIIQRIGRW
jgi:putative transposase